MKKFTGLTVMLFVLFIVANVVGAAVESNELDLIGTLQYDTNNKLYGSQEIRVIGDRAYVISYKSNTFSVYDVKDRTSPKYLWRKDNIPGPLGLTIFYDERNRGFAYIVTDPSIDTVGGKFVIIYLEIMPDGSHPMRMIDGYGGRNIVTDGDYAYIAGHSNNAAYIFDISSPWYVKSKATIDSTLPGLPRLNRVYTLDVEDNYLYIASDNEETQQSLIAKIDVTDSTNPFYVDHFDHVQGEDLLYRPVGLVVKGQYAYVATLNPPNPYTVYRNDTGNALMIFRVATLDVIGSEYIGSWDGSYFDTLGGPEGLISVDDQYAYVPIWRWLRWDFSENKYLDVPSVPEGESGKGGLAVIDISNPWLPRNVSDTRFGGDVCSGQAYYVNDYNKYLYCVSFRTNIGAELNIYKSYLP